MSDNIEYPVKGACQCGNVTYELTEPPFLVVACHCKECQKLSTSAYSITAMVKAQSLNVQGELKHWERGSDSGAINAAKFCPECGNRIYHYNPAEPEKIKLKLKPSNLENTRLIQPTVHLWVSEKQPWVEIPEGVKQFEKQPS
jgi:hypothetical protein